MNDTLEQLRDAARAHGRINIQINDLLEVARKAAIRAYVFIGYGLNGVNNPLADYKIDMPQQHLSELRFNNVLAEIDVDNVPDAKDEFRRWLIGNGFSEYIHITSTFYDLLYTYLLFFEHLATGNAFAEQLRRERVFKKKMSLSDKMQLLSDEVGVEANILKYIAGLNKMRNCMIHNAGLVTDRYCNDGDNLVVRWRRHELFTRQTDGTETVLRAGVVMEEECLLFARLRETEKRFQKGEFVNMEFQDVFEILMFAQIDLADLSKSINDYCAKVAGTAGVSGSGNEKGGLDWSISVGANERF